MLAGLGEYESAIARIDQAITAKSQTGQRSPSRGRVAMGSAYALACKGGVLADRGQFDDAHACFREALDLLAGSTHPIGNSVRNWVAVAYNWQGRWNEAAAMAESSLEIAENTRALLLASSAMAWALLSVPAAAETAGAAQVAQAADSVVTFDIPAQALSGALIAFGQQQRALDG